MYVYKRHTSHIRATFKLNLLGILTLLRDRKRHTHTQHSDRHHFPFSMVWILLIVTNRFTKDLLGYGAFSVSETKCSSFTSSVIFHLAYFIVNYYLFSRNNIGKSLSMLGTEAINMKGKPLYNNICILRDMF